MDVKSALPTKKVTDFDFTFAGGLKFTLTVSEYDVVETKDGGMHVQHFVDGELSEEYSINLTNLLYVGKRYRMVTIYPPGQSPLELELAKLTKS